MTDVVETKHPMYFHCKVDCDRQPTSKQPVATDGERVQTGQVERLHVGAGAVCAALAQEVVAGDDEQAGQE